MRCHGQVARVGSFRSPLESPACSWGFVPIPLAHQNKLMSKSPTHGLHRMISELRPGARLPSERDLAAQLGVGRTVINRAIRELVGAGTLRREGYKLFLAEVPGERPLDVALVGPDEALLRPAQQLSAEMGAAAVVVVAEENLHRKALLDLLEHRPDGVLNWYDRHLDVLVQIEARGVPVIVCGHEWAGRSFVTGDFSRKARMAVEHLAGLGHREIAFFGVSTEGIFGPIRAKILEGYREACLRLGFRGSARRVFNPTGDRALRQAWEELCTARRAPTGIIAQDLRTAEGILGLAAAAGLSVPDDLSVVSLHERSGAALTEPPLTTVDVDEGVMSRLAVSLLVAEIRRRHNVSGAPKSRGVVCLPTLTERSSTAAPRVRAKKKLLVAALEDEGDLVDRSRRWSDDEHERRAQAARINSRRHEGAGGRKTRFEVLDLSGSVNRALGPRSAWLGDHPLRYFDAGEHVIHGIRFRVAQGRNPTHSAIVLRSRKCRTSDGKDLPVEIRIPVGKQAERLFILHAAGWVVRHEAFARYEIVYADGSSESLDVMALGQHRPRSKREKRWREESVVQDWHPSHPVLEPGRVLPWLVTEDGDPYLYERYLYSLRWENPHPRKTIRSLRVLSLKPEIRATLAVLAVTLESGS